MRIHERLLFIPVLILSVIFFLLMLRSEMNYMVLQTKYETINDLNDKLIEQVKNKTGFIIKATSADTRNGAKKTSIGAKVTSTGVKIPSIEVKIKSNSTEINNSSTKPVHRENKFMDLHKYSLYNPDFRFLMEWPPRVTIPPYNPRLADILNKPVKRGLPSWERFNLQITKQYIYKENAKAVEDVLHDMAMLKITAVEQFPAGMQFKLLVTFENGGQAIFKPERFPRGVDVHPNMIYKSDFERHTSEIAAFHLDSSSFYPSPFFILPKPVLHLTCTAGILGFRKTPPVVGRKVNITGDLFRLANAEFVRTFYFSPDGNYCFHGICRLYCETHHGFCGNPDMIEGSFQAWMVTEPHYILDHSYIRSPWKRTYITNKIAAWEDDSYYCENFVRKTEPFDEGRRLYDAIDLSIFDFLIDNMDRHHYDFHGVFGNDNTSTLIHLDNGRGFRRADHDEESILAPLDQCCEVRLSTFNKLYELHVGPRPLSDLMRESLANDPLAPILTEPHLQALDRRVDKILTSIQNCIKANSGSFVFLDDIL